MINYKTPIQVFISLFFILGSKKLFSQDLNNYNLIKELKVKSEIIYKSGTFNDTIIKKYDEFGRLTYFKSNEETDSIFYKKRTSIKKIYENSYSPVIQTIETRDRNDNITFFEYSSFNYGSTSISTSIHKYKGDRCYKSEFYVNGKITNTMYWEKEIQNDNIKYYENDSTYSYSLNNDEVFHFYSPNYKKRELGMLAFNDNGQIIHSYNYVNYKKNEVRTYIREYDIENKTFTEIINYEYFNENGLIFKSIDNILNITETHYYEFY
ncbi:MAG: hypothetical protein ACK479_08180 [Fluviicola sp.]|jgi:hypothetical protein